MMINPLPTALAAGLPAELDSPCLKQRMQEQARAMSSSQAATGKDDDDDALFEFRMSFPQMRLDLEDDEELKAPDALPMMLTIRVQAEVAPNSEHKDRTGTSGKTDQPLKAAQPHVIRAEHGSEPIRGTQIALPSRDGPGGTSRLRAGDRFAAAHAAPVRHSKGNPGLGTPMGAAGPERSSGAETSFKPRTEASTNVGPPVSTRASSPSSSHRSSFDANGAVGAQPKTSRVEPIMASADIAPSGSRHAAPKREVKDSSRVEGVVRHDMALPHPDARAGELKSDNLPRQPNAHGNAQVFASATPPLTFPEPAGESGVTYRFRSLGPQASVDLRFDANTSAGTVFATPSNEQVRHLIDASLRDSASAPAGLQFEDREERGDHRRHPHPNTDDQAEEQDAG
jgi:hypothetical protein